MKKKKVLVIERVSSLEEVLSTYIHDNMPDSKVDIIYNAEDVPMEKLVKAIDSHDTIVFQSIFHDTELFEKMVLLFDQKRFKNKSVYVIHTLNEFLPALESLPPNVYAKLAMLIKYDGLNLYNVYHKAFENPKNTEGAFRYFKNPNIIKFDTVKMWYDGDGSKRIWDERPHYISGWSKEFFRHYSIKD